MKVIINALRGGDDCGDKIGGKLEKDFNLEISKYIYQRLKFFGIDVVLVRDSDETLDIESRISFIKNFKSDDVIVLSCGCCDKNNMIVYSLRNSGELANSIYKEFKKCDIDTICYQRRFSLNYLKDYYQILRDISVGEGIIVFYNKNIDGKIYEWGDIVVRGILQYLKKEIDGDFYQVESGDSLYSIAKKYGVSFLNIKESNGLKSNMVRVGQILKIPKE